MKTFAWIIGLSPMLFAVACVANDITGTIIPPFPEGWKDQGGVCVGSSLGSNKGCAYSIGVLEKSDRRILYIGKSAPRIDPKKARWLVTDQIYIKEPAGFHFVFALCESDGEPDETIIAMVRTTDTEWYTAVRLAYRASLRTGRFVKISTKGVRCLNDGWGV